MAALTVDWDMSGRGQDCALALPEVQRLCVASGFVFKGDREDLPLARRADMQAMFDHFGVNSLSAFRQKFWSCKLRPGAPGTEQSSGGSSTLQPAAAGGRVSRWQVLQHGLGETYIGELLDGRRHGIGLLLSQGQQSTVLHVGRFCEGKRSGPGLVITSRGERFEGFFLDDVMWGPGIYTYAPVPAAAATAASGCCGSPAEHAHEPTSPGEEQAPPGTAAGPRSRATFQGMMNGRPQGKGVMTWSDGSQQVGQFDGNNCYLGLQRDEVAGVLMVAADNAAEARAFAAVAEEQAQRQQQGVLQDMQRLLAAVSKAPRQAAARDDNKCFTARDMHALKN